jgi:hypothetical protein
MADDSSRGLEMMGAWSSPPSAMMLVREASGDYGGNSRPLDVAWSALKWRCGGDVINVAASMGKSRARGRRGLYLKGNGSCGCKTSSLSSSPTESMIHSLLLRIWFGYDFTTVSFLRSEVFMICGSRPSQNGHAVPVMV